MTEGQKKGVSLTTAIALGTVCIILSACLVGAVVNYASVIDGKDSLIDGKDGIIEAKNSQISSLDSQISDLQDQVSDLSSAPVFQPVQFSGSMQITSGTLANGVTYFYMVPNGTRLVIEYVSARVDNLDPADTIDLQIVTRVNGTQVEHYLGAADPQGRTKIDPYSQAQQFVSQEVRIYADPGSYVSVGGNRDTRTNNVLVVFSFSGYLVNVS